MITVTKGIDAITLSQKVVTTACCDAGSCHNRSCPHLSTFGDRAFPVAASRIWNWLPLNSSLHHYLYKLSRRGLSRFVQKHFSVLMYCDFVHSLAAFGLDALLIR